MLCTRNGKTRAKSQIIAWFDKAINVGLLFSSIKKVFQWELLTCN